MLNPDWKPVVRWITAQAPPPLAVPPRRPICLGMRDADFTARPTTDQERHSRSLAVWLLSVATMVAIMVVLGGLTRLTGSGLSMAQWNPHHLLPPLSAEQWDQAFAQYRQTPEFRLVNPHMDKAGYQGIFVLEYIHRLWGRLIGLAFAVPLAWFAWRRRLPAGQTLRLLGLLALGGAQSLVGWLMVASGLVDVPQVSHLRLAAHLLLALIILAALIWTALDLLHPAKTPPDPAFPGLAFPDLAFKVTAAVAALALATMAWGALVAGLHAGKVFNTFPLMEGAWFPTGALIERPPLVNALVTPAAVQYVHRVLAMTTWACLSLLGLWAGLTGRARPLWLAAAWTWIQAALGIATLVQGAPLALAALHQGGAVILLALLTWALHTLRR